MLTKVFQYSLIFNKQFMIPIVALGMCLVGKNAYLGICRLGKMPPWESAEGENAALGKCRLGNVPLGKMPTWENAALGKCRLGKLPLGKLPWWNVLRGKCRGRNVLEPILKPCDYSC